MIQHISKNLKGKVKTLLLLLKGYLNRNAKLKKILLSILEYIPALKRRLQTIGQNPQKVYKRHIRLTPDYLSQEEKDIYLQLRHIKNLGK